MPLQFWDILFRRNDFQLALYCQPILPCRSYPHVPHYEVLLRVCYQGQIFSLGDEFELIVKLPELARVIDRRVIEQVHRSLPPQNIYFVNLFPETLELSFPSWLKSFGKTHQIVLELTERSPLNPVQESVLAQVSQIYPVWLDDYGLAYSSPLLLTTNLFSWFKVTGEIVEQVCVNRVAEGLILSAMLLAQHCKIGVVMEHVSTGALKQKLQDLHAKYPEVEVWMQGWAIGHPKNLSADGGTFGLEN